jgi:hypothetical protein
MNVEAALFIDFIAPEDLDKVASDVLGGEQHIDEHLLLSDLQDFLRDLGLFDVSLEPNIN